MLTSEELSDYKQLWKKYEKELNKFIFAHYPCAFRTSLHGKPNIKCVTKIRNWGIDYPEHGDKINEVVVENLFTLVKTHHPELLWAIRMTTKVEEEDE